MKICDYANNRWACAHPPCVHAVYHDEVDACGEPAPCYSEGKGIEVRCNETENPYRQPQTPTTGVKAIIGAIPGAPGEPEEAGK